MPILTSLSLPSASHNPQVQKRKQRIGAHCGRQKDVQENGLTVELTTGLERR